ncbi:MAG: DNA translocase FtsK 4TM domain-containing protein [Acidobacteriota bacterium]|nr:DNA translocase FtsK 4TM domain-containing protein [Acidobacteriota bacterium]
MSGETKKRHEFLGVALLVLAVLLVLCLLTHHSGDHSLNTLSSAPTVANKAGRLGALVSDLLYQALGFASFLLLVPLTVVSWKLVFGRPFKEPCLRAFGYLLLIVGSAALLELLPFPEGSFDFHPGGFVGVLTGGLLLPNLNRTGTFIVLVGALVLGILAATPFTLAGGFSRFELRIRQPRPGLAGRWRRWRENRRPVRAVVNIKPPVQALQLTPRPEPVKAPAPPRVAARPAPVREEVREETMEAPPAPSAGARAGNFRIPDVELLSVGENPFPVDETELMERARLIAAKCAEFDVNGRIDKIHPGPVVTTFEFKPDAGVKYARITGLVDDLCLGIKAESMRIDRIPGKATVGIEVPNVHREIIMLRELIDSDSFRKSPSKLTLALGKLINGAPYMTDLAKMPHLLIAGATGAGKSVALNAMITSILYKATPEEVRFIFIDPKRLELGLYADIPHLLTEIVTDPAEAANALRWATNEMESRYKKLAEMKVRSIDQYNTKLRSAGAQMSPPKDGAPGGEPEKPLSYIVLVIDELADLMMVAGREVEESISRLAAMARAVGIHLILATQRPSVDVITGVIKANFPSRIAFKVASKVDSRTIIDCNGAEQLLGNGDMLFIPPGSARLTRIHGAYVSETEVQAIVEHLRKQGIPSYDDSILTYGQQEVDEAGNPVDGSMTDPLYNDAVRTVVSEGRGSTSLLQRRLSIGYGRAAKLVDMMFHNGVVGPAEGSKPREVLVGPDFLDRLEEL